jgi:hypothetical protein
MLLYNDLWRNRLISKMDYWPTSHPVPDNLTCLVFRISDLTVNLARS